MTTKPALPFPNGINLQVFRDDGKWDNYTKWFMRTHKQINELFVAKITLAHYEGQDEVAYDSAEWVVKSNQLVEDYPNCVFIYTSYND